ncbi:uncharacterized protein LOC120524642 [Polypterus senegalus]|uniref:uncharacterized protein LOC120524642 n=1 Tax=Polypterus senegalus TaxID=55291 RepID=UPI0019627DD5|nr:uncharacterized protein LOC120524642 [Polypterus senegalus]
MVYGTVDVWLYMSRRMPVEAVLYILISLAVLLVSAILLIAALVYCGYLCQDGAALPQVLVSLQVSQNENDQQRCLIGEDACISKISYFCKPRASWATESSDEEEAISDQEECYENRAFRASEMEPVDTEDGDDSTGTFSVEVENIYELQRPEEQLSLNVDYKSEGCLAQQELQPEPPSCEDITAFNEVPLFSVILGDVDKNLIDSGQKACNGDSETSNHSVLPSEQASLLGETVTDADYRTEGSVTGAGGAGDPWYSSEDEPDDGQPSDYMARLVAPS